MNQDSRGSATFVAIFQPGLHVISTRVFSHCTPGTVANLSRVNRCIQEAAMDYKFRAYNINKRLSRFSNNPKAFRSLQKQTATIISGSFALQFFDRTYYDESDLDLYVHPDSSCLLLGHHLIESEGYLFVPYSWQLESYDNEARRLCDQMHLPLSDIEDSMEFEHAYKIRSVRTVYNFVRTHNPTPGGKRKIQLIVCRSSPMASLMDFHSTCVMNVITYNAAYSLYPFATFELNISLVLNDREPNAPAALRKYSRRGWKSIASDSSLVHYLEPRAFSLDTLRWVCDGRSWTIPLPTDGFSEPLSGKQLSPKAIAHARDPISECGWYLVSADERILVAFRIISTTILRWRYTAGDWEYAERLINFFMAQGRVEHLKVPEGKNWSDCMDVWTWYGLCVRYRFELGD
ncbi:hypothetical protein C8Q79DRAFT_909306 [Trametes meyenii]|nr:hypothetical protein C8Q79DRAFT_909306 [Trametes meyenii]